jgi:predicted Zn-dependent protease
MKSICNLLLSICLAIGCYALAFPVDAESSGQPDTATRPTSIIGSVGAEERTEPARLLFAEKKKKKEEKETGLGTLFKVLEGVGAIATGVQGIDYNSERAIGESLALEAFHRYGLPINERRLQRYVNLVGNAVARNSGRPGIPYRFVVVDSPLYNAFACPGGIIFVTSTLVKLMNSEAELACVLAHEVAHVSHKHALETIRRAKFFEGVSKISETTMKGEKGKEFRSMINDLQTTLFDRGLDKRMELQADTSAMETAYRTGYDPYGMIRVLQALQKIEARAQKAGSWFSTHPPLRMRINNCMNQLRSYPDAKTLATVSSRFARQKGRIP